MYYEVLTGTEQTLKDRINGACLLGPIPTSGLALGGLTLIFTTPLVTVTFPGSAGALVTPSDAVAAITTAVTDMRVDLRAGTGGQFLVMYRDPGFVIGSAGTANTLLRLSTSAPTESLGADATAAVVLFQRASGPGSYVLIRARGAF